MPTITIRTGALPATQRRLVALRLARWLGAEGVEPAHAVVRFEDSADGSVYVGGLPVEALDPGAERPVHAEVTCCVGPDRDGDFRARLATEIARALPTGASMPFLYLEFRPTSPADVWIGRHGELRRADDHPAPTTVPAEELS
jgi:hypothetical protein